MSNFNQFKTIYFEECNELLAVIEENLSEIKNGDQSEDRIHAVFRAIHSIKGGAGSFSFTALIEFAHLFETVLDAFRNHRLIMTEEFCEILLRSNDVLSDLVQSASAESDDVPLQLPGIREKLKAMNVASNGGDAVVLEKKTVAVKEEKSTDRKAYTAFRITFKPKPGLMKSGNEPKFIIDELKSLAVINDESAFVIQANLDDLPELHALDVAVCYMWWIIDLKTESAVQRVTDSFEFVDDECDIAIDVLEEVEEIPAMVAPSPVQKIETVIVPKESIKDQKTKPQEEVAHSIRVELDRIDRMVNTVGEMVIKQAMLLDKAQALTNDASNTINKDLQDLTQHMRDLQEYVMAIRAQPVKTVFTRMPRLVRELSLELNKEIRIETFGENTEIDKTVIERLGEPLTHMIRNAIDHGIEKTEDRIAHGKTAYGTIRLSAEHKSGRILIEIADDGHGINRARVLQKAIAQGLVSADNTLSGEEIDNLIFLPGFSTAETVTNISGRGVGMDVVKKSIQSLGGRISIASSEGKGCRFTLTLPLTLAVLDGMIVSAGAELYIVPLVNIIESIRPNRSQISKLVGCHDILNLRNKTIPLVYLYEIFNIPNALHDPCDGIVMIVESEGGELIGLVVDELHKQQQVVIKSIEENYDPIPGISGATILGNGNVSMILDVTSLTTLGQSINDIRSSKGMHELKEER